MGRYKPLGSLHSFLSYAPQLSKANPVSFFTLLLSFPAPQQSPWGLGGKKTPSIVHTRLTRLWSQYHVLRLCQGAIWFPLPREACNLQSGLPEPHLDFPWSQDSCSTKTFCFTATKNKRTSDLELRGCSSTLTSLLGPLRLLTTGTSVLELLNFPKAFPSCHLVEMLHSSLGEIGRAHV